MMVLLVPVSAQSTEEIPVAGIGYDIVAISLTVDTDGEVNSTLNHEALLKELPVVYYGENADLFNDLYNFSLTLTGETDNSTKHVALGGGIQTLKQVLIEQTYSIKDYSYNPGHFNTSREWIGETFR